MKSSCSARGLSTSQTLPETALIHSVSRSPPTFSFCLSLYSSWSTPSHPHSLFISPYWSAFTCLFPRLSVPSASSAVPSPAPVCFLSYCLPSVGLPLNWSVIATISVDILFSWGLHFSLAIVSFWWRITFLRYVLSLPLSLAHFLNSSHWPWFLKPSCDMSWAFAFLWDFSHHCSKEL